jgi:hypothetical protein
MRRLAACLLLSVATPAFAAPAGAGIWFGIGQTGDKGGMYIDNMLPDGRIITQFRSCVKGKGDDHLQEGTWSVSGGTLTIRVIRWDGQPAARTDVYKVLSITGRNFDYDLLPTKFPFRARRVNADFKMPSCDMIS